MDFTTSRRTSATRSTSSSTHILNTRSKVIHSDLLLPPKRSSPRTNGFTTNPPTGETSRSTSPNTADDTTLNDEVNHNGDSEPFDPYTYTPHTSLPPITPRPSSQPPIDATVTILDRSIPSTGMPLYRLHVISSSPGASKHELQVPLTRIGRFVSAGQLEEFENGLFRREGAEARERERGEALNGTAAMRRAAHKNGALDRVEGDTRGVKRKRGPGRPPKKSFLVQVESTESTEGSKSESRGSSAVTADGPRMKAYVEVSVTPLSGIATRQRNEEATVKAQRSEEVTLEAQRYAPRSPQPLRAADHAQRPKSFFPQQLSTGDHVRDDLATQDTGVKSTVNGEDDDIEDVDEDELALPVPLQNRHLSAPSPRVPSYPPRRLPLSHSPQPSPSPRLPRAPYKAEISETSEEDEIKDDQTQDANFNKRPSQQLRQENNTARLPIRATAPDVPVANRTGCPQHPQRRRAGCKICHPTPKSETWRQQLEKIKAPLSRPTKPSPAERGSGAKVKSGVAKTKQENAHRLKSSPSKPAAGSKQRSQSHSHPLSTTAEPVSLQSRGTTHFARSPIQPSSNNPNENILKHEDEDMSEGEYEIEAILSDKLINGERSYFVKWLGYDYTSGSWMKESDLTDAEEMVEEYLLRKMEAGVDGVLDDDEELGEDSELGF
ncbi:methylated histone binding [Coniosporium apollinis]|uniref:Methylated histone binding n=1 Tax=Coniosporium apollinis TaxID=61459 RepID=A0ABQ9NTT2_9PEZI|nr:methylated histone binding [Coniosporium apollinis]